MATPLLLESSAVVSIAIGDWHTIPGTSMSMNTNDSLLQSMFHLMTCGDAQIAYGQTWLSQPLPLSTVPNTGSLFDSSDQGFNEEEVQVRAHQSFTTNTY